MSKSITKNPKDQRNKLWQKFESEIQTNNENKDSRFKLKGSWKKFLKTEQRFKIYLVDGNWIRTNLSFIFGHGGHGYVHEFIPNDEIWIDTQHAKSCQCKNVSKNRKMSLSYRNSTILHEITEYKEMKKGKIFWVSHNIALGSERKAGFLLDPYSEV